jgi:hypothetical protein
MEIFSWFSLNIPGTRYEATSFNTIAWMGILWSINVYQLEFNMQLTGFLSVMKISVRTAIYGSSVTYACNSTPTHNTNKLWLYVVSTHSNTVILRSNSLYEELLKSTDNLNCIAMCHIICYQFESTAQSIGTYHTTLYLIIFCNNYISNSF